LKTQVIFTALEILDKVRTQQTEEHTGVDVLKALSSTCKLFTRHSMGGTTDQ
jgi:hypothetical protein